MAYPDSYTRDYGFSQFQEGHPSTPLPGDQVDTELDGAGRSTAAIIAFLKKIARSDGKLLNGSVGVDQLSPDLSIGFKAPTSWASDVTYAVDDTVFYASAFYTCKTAHVSGGSFEAAYWTLIADFAAAAAPGNAAASAASASAAAAAASAATATTAATTASDAAASAASDAADAAANAAVTAVKSTTWRNIFTVLTDAEIADVQARTVSLNHQPSIQTAMTANPGTTWFFPEGTYNLFSTVSLDLPEGITWIGAGSGNTIVKIANDGDWGIQQINPNGTTTVKGFSASHIKFLITNNGIRLNDETASIDDTSGTMYYIERAFFTECEFLFNGAPSTKTMLHFSKCFNSGVEKCKFSAGHKQIDFRGCDICFVYDCRMDNATNGCVSFTSVGSFGNQFKIDHGDWNNPKNYFYRGAAQDLVLENVKMELDGSPGSTGTGGNMEAAIDITSGNAFRTVLRDNNTAVGGFCDHWLRYRSSNPYILIAEGNGATDDGSASADVNLGFGRYFTNSGTRTVYMHRGNVYQGSDNNWPMNYQTGDVGDNPGDLILLSASRPGVGFTGLAGNLTVSGGDFLIGPDADTSKYLEFSDWGACGMPANQVIGHLFVMFNTYGSVNGQVFSYEVLDGASVLASGTVTHTVANKVYQTVLSAFDVAATLKIRFWNADTANGGNCSFRRGSVRFG